MNIKHTDWHYRILHEAQKCKIEGKVYDKIPISLCSYFWSVVGALVIWVAVGVLALAAVAGVLYVTYAILYLWGFLVADWFSLSQEWVSLPALTLSLVLNCVGAGVAFLYYVHRNGRELYHKIQKIEPKWEEPPLVLQYLQAKKSKVCPFINIELGEDRWE